MLARSPRLSRGAPFAEANLPEPEPDRRSPGVTLRPPGLAQSTQRLANPVNVMGER